MKLDKNRQKNKKIIDQIEFSKHETAISDKIAKEWARLFEATLRKNIITDASLQKELFAEEEQTTRFFPLIEDRKGDVLSLSSHTKDENDIEIRTKSKGNGDDEDNEFELKPESFETTYFNKIYLNSTSSGKTKNDPFVYKLNNELLKGSNEILKDADKYLEKNSVLNDIDKKVMAPHINKKLEMKYTGEYMNEMKKKQSNAGRKWYNMPKVEMTPELEREVKAIKLSHTLTGGRVYLKKRKFDEEYFQIGTVKEGSGEFYSSRLSKKERKSTFLRQIMNEQKQTTNYVDTQYDRNINMLTPTQYRKRIKYKKKAKKELL